MTTGTNTSVIQSGIMRYVQRSAAVAIFTAFVLSIAPDVALAGDHEGRRVGEYRQDGSYESKIYGTVEKMPPDLVGAWIVNRREITVTKDTRIKEKHGKIEPGAYVKVEGNITGKTFTAYEIEVKRAKETSR